MDDRPPDERIADAWREARAAAAGLRSLDARPLAVGWATVELDRATAELAVAFDLPGREPFLAAQRSVTLGAAARVAAGAGPDGGSLVVLEPDTEGRLAAALARLGEGPVVTWLEVDRSGHGVGALRGAGLRVSPERDGPFGPERLIAGPADIPGRHRLLVARLAGTIRP
ncbi:MAG: hypothetical protein HY262_13710 [Chloroflexi bacterium]|nr:hypothetical protein [Chloroflexota bacterium]